MPNKLRFCTHMELHCSKTDLSNAGKRAGFVPIWNYIVLKRYHICNTSTKSFVPIWNYIVLKQGLLLPNTSSSFVPIWNYIVLKLYQRASEKRLGFVPIWNYIVLKPQIGQEQPVR